MRVVGRQLPAYLTARFFHRYFTSAGSAGSCSVGFIYVKGVNRVNNILIYNMLHIG